MSVWVFPRFIGLIEESNVNVLLWTGDLAKPTQTWIFIINRFSINVEFRRHELQLNCGKIIFQSLIDKQVSTLTW